MVRVGVVNQESSNKAWEEITQDSTPPRRPLTEMFLWCQGSLGSLLCQF